MRPAGKTEQEANANDGKCIAADLENSKHRDKPRSKRGSDVSAQDHTQRLFERQEPCIYKTDSHHRRGGTRLNQTRYAGAHGYRDYTSLRERFQQFLEFLTGNFLQTIGHQTHAEEKQAQPPYRA